MVTLRLACYNLHDLLDDRAALGRVLRTLAADVVCVQEVPRTPAGDLAAWRLARATGYRTGWTHAGGGGTTIFTGPRVRVESLRHEPLSVPAGQRRRGVAVLDAVIAGTALRAVSLHLGLQGVQRLRHTHHLLGLLDVDRPVVLAGDANEGLEAPAVTALQRHVEPLGTTPATFPAEGPEHAIDLVLGRGVRAAREVEIPLPPQLLAAASDHRPRLLEIDLPPR